MCSDEYKHQHVGWADRHYTDSIKPKALNVVLSDICFLFSDTQLSDHWQTLVPNTAIFPPCHQMVPLRMAAWLVFVFYLELGL